MFDDRQEKLEEIRAQVREWAIRELTPVSDRWDREVEPKFPGELYCRMGELGFIGFNSPVEYGGQGKSNTEFAAVIEELGYHDVAFAVMCGIGRLFTYPLLRWGADHLKTRYVADCVSGRRVCAFALSEPGAGSDAAGLQTVARTDGDEFVIYGEKTLVTSGDAAEVVLLFCRVEGYRKISAFVVDTGQPGWKARALERKLGIRASTTAHLTLDGVRTPAVNLVGNFDDGFKIAMATLDGARISVAAQGVGVARRALDESVRYAKKRHAFGAPIAKLQAIQWMIADMATRLEAARLLTYRAAHLQDRGESVSLAAAQAKLFAAETANFCVDRAVQIHGGYGFIGEFSPVEKLYRDQRFLQIGEGTSEIQRMVIARTILDGSGN
ncbi:MAG: acyl-CoA dehydrogenase family protein [Candidatus Zixiibacteriota bacterium]